MHWRRLVSWGLVAAAAGLVWTVALADTIKMKDGKTYTGTAEVIGDKVRVTLADGSTVLLKGEDVQEVIRARTVLQEYAEREAAVRPDDVEGRFNLALWCDRNGLKTEAVRETAKALAIQPDHRGARELMLQLLRAAGVEPATPGTPAPGTAEPQPIARRNLLLEERQSTQTYFRMRVQPVLSTKCASAVCHGGTAGGKLVLKRSPIGILPGPDVYLTNFDAIYPYITDFYKPDKSLLLQHPLAVKEGGIPSKCEKVFVSKDDPSYQVVARLITSLLLPAPPKPEGGAKD